MAEYITENDLNEYVKSSELNTSEIFKTGNYTNQDNIYGGGLIIKSGYQACPANATTSVTFNSPFPNKIFGLWLTQHGAVQTYTGGDVPSVVSLTTSGFSFKITTTRTNTRAVSWLVIGY